MAFMYQTERNTRPTNRPFYNPIRWLLQRDISWNIYQDKGVFSSKQPESYKIFQNMWRVFAFQLFSILLPNVRCKDIAVFSLAGVDEGPDKSYLKWTQGPAGRQSFNALSLCMRWAGFYPKDQCHLWKGHKKDNIVSGNISCVKNMNPQPCQVQPQLDKRANREDKGNGVGHCHERRGEWKQRRGVRNIFCKCKNMNSFIVQ